MKRQDFAASGSQLLVDTVLIMISISIGDCVSARPLTVDEFGQLALRCGPSVAPFTLASIARTESGFEPLSIHDNTTGATNAPPSRDIAIQMASKMLERGDSVDIGIMQINSANFSRFNLTLEDAFDPCRSVNIGATVLADDYAGGETYDRQQAALRVAISRYNTGNAQRGFTNGYVHKVELAAAHLVPALDTGPATASKDADKTYVAAPRPFVDPNAPPVWDVWSSYDYAATANSKPHPAPNSDPVPNPAGAAAADANVTWSATSPEAVF